MGWMDRALVVEVLYIDRSNEIERYIERESIWALMIDSIDV